MPIGLADRALRYFERHPDRRPGSFLSPADRDWRTATDLGAREIERIRQRYPVERVRWAAEVLGLDERRGRRPARRLDRMQEQVYRAHYNSYKIRHSWNDAAVGAVALAGLLGCLSPEDREAWVRGRGPEVFRPVLDGALAALSGGVWPNEGLGPLFEEMVAEDFWGHIPLRAGAVALGLRLLLADYARNVVGVLTALHRNSVYTYGLCHGRTLSWAEAMVFKTLPAPAARWADDVRAGG